MACQDPVWAFLSVCVEHSQGVFHFTNGNRFRSNLANRFGNGLLHETKRVESSNNVYFSINKLLYILVVIIALSVVLLI